MQAYPYRLRSTNKCPPCYFLHSTTVCNFNRIQIVNWKTSYTDFPLPVRVITPAKTKEQKDVESVHLDLCRLKCIQLQGCGLPILMGWGCLFFFHLIILAIFPQNTEAYQRGSQYSNFNYLGSHTKNTKKLH